MIRLRHADGWVELDPTRHADLGSAIAAWQATQPARMVVRELRLDGECHEAPDPALLDDIALTPESDIEVELVSARSVALSSLNSAAEYAPRVRNASLETAERLRSGRPDLAAPLLADLMDALVVLSGALAAAGAELGECASGLAGMDAELDGCLGGLVGAHERGDWIDLADGLEFELASLLESWCRRIEGAGQAAGASA